MKKSIGILTFTCPCRDPRVARQIRFLTEYGYHLKVLGAECNEKLQCSNSGTHFLSSKKDDFIFQRIKKYLFLSMRDFERAFWSRKMVQDLWQHRDALQGIKVLIANDIETLPLAVALAKYTDAKLILDAHEYAPRQFEDRWRQRVFVLPQVRYLCRHYLPHVDAMCTVSPTFAQTYEREFGIRPFLVYNAPPYYDLAPRKKAPGEIIHLVHHGGAISSRRLERMIRAMQWLDDRFRLHFYLVPTQRRYFRYLRILARRDPRIHFHNPVPLEKIVPTIHQYDVGVFLLPPTNYNYAHALPNKFFEFLQARLAVAIGPSKDMQMILQKEKFGIVSPDFTAKSFAATLSKLDHDQINRMKDRSHAVAHVYAAEHEYQKLRAAVERLIEYE